MHLAGQYGRNLGGNQALIVSDPGVLAAGWVQQVLACVGRAGLESTLFTRVTPNPRSEEVAAGAVVYAEQGCDIIVAVAGGSVIDCAKGIGLLAANQGGIRDLVGVDNVDADEEHATIWEDSPHSTEDVMTTILPPGASAPENSYGISGIGMDVRRQALLRLRSNCSHGWRARYLEKRNSARHDEIPWSPIR